MLLFSSQDSTHKLGMEAEFGDKVSLTWPMSNLPNGIETTLNGGASPGGGIQLI